MLLSRVLILVVLGFIPGTLVFGQGTPAPQSRGGRPDKIQRELERRVEMQMIEQALKEEDGSRHVRRYPPLVLDQIREDFLQIQVIDRKLMQATAVANTLDLELVARSVGEIRKRSRRLKENLALPPPETPVVQRSRINVEATSERLRTSISDLSDLIEEFVSNPMFEQSKLVDARLSVKAQQDVEGIIELSTYLTIAGQTAPGDGVCLRNFTFNIATHDVVVRYLRSRLGDLSSQEADSITLLSGAHDVVLDHCSATWSIDESLSLAGNVSNVTVQWCLIGSALNHSKHSKGDHGYGSLSRANGPVTWHHNLWVHNNSRNPRLGDNYGRPPFPTFDVRNNVMYDYGEICSGLTQGVLKVNYVANYIRPGPSSKAKTPIHIGGPSQLSFYIKDNVFEGNPAQTADNSQFFDPVVIDGKRQVETVTQAFAAPVVRTSSAQDAYAAVLATVGASLPRRDSVDAQIINDVRSGKGSIIDSQTQVGGWPELKSATPPIDTDGDGMPDSWERRHGLNPRDASDGATDRDKDGYTNLEEYLNNTDPNKYVDYRVLP